MGHYFNTIRITIVLIAITNILQWSSPLLPIIVPDKNDASSPPPPPPTTTGLKSQRAECRNWDFQKLSQRDSCASQVENTVLAMPRNVLGNSALAVLLPRRKKDSFLPSVVLRLWGSASQTRLHMRATWGALESGPRSGPAPMQLSQNLWG